jgi:hypothetical protein
MNSMAMLVVILMLDGKITKYEYPMNVIECMSAVENAKKSRQCYIVLRKNQKR